MARDVRATLGRDTASAFRMDVASRSGDPPAAQPESRIREIPALAARFREDPLTALRTAIPPHDRPADIDDFARRGLLTEIVDYVQDAERVVRDEESSPEYRFIRLVMGFARDRGVGNSGLSTDMDLPITAANTQNVFAGAAATAPPVATGAPGAAPVDDDAAFSRQILTHMDTTKVMGKLELTDEMNSSVQDVLTRLRQANYPKFLGKTREHFYGDENAMTQLALLTAIRMAIGKITAPNRYVMSAEENKRRKELKDEIDVMDAQYVWSSTKRSFVQASVIDYNKNTAAIQERRLIERTPRRY